MATCSQKMVIQQKQLFSYEGPEPRKTKKVYFQKIKNNLEICQ